MKYWNYIILSIGLVLILQLAGFSGLGGEVLGYIGVTTTNETGISVPDGFDLKSSDMYTYFFNEDDDDDSNIPGILIAAIGAAIVIGFITKSSSENYVILPFIIGGALVFFTIWITIVTHSYANFTDWIAHSILVISVILSIGFLVASYEHFRGTD